MTVILFSILLSTGIGSYLSGRLFNKKPYRAIVVSIPVLVSLIAFSYGFLQQLITSNIGLDLPQRIALTFALLSPIGIVMGFQFPSIIRVAYSFFGMVDEKSKSYTRNESRLVTLLWGVNVIASVIGTVLAAVSSMTIGFSGNLLIAVGLYLAALCSAVMVQRQEHLVSREDGSIWQI